MLQYSQCPGALGFPIAEQPMAQHQYKLHYPPRQLIRNPNQDISEVSTTTTLE